MISFETQYEGSKTIVCSMPRMYYETVGKNNPCFATEPLIV